MRDLDFNELQFVTGAGSSPSRPSGSGCSPTPPSSGKTKKGNNGFGNGSDDPNLAAPGGSGKTGGGKEGSVGDTRGER